MPDTIQYNPNTRARKEHTCYFCGGTIHKGEVYEYSFNKYEGDAYSLHIHKKCMKMASDCGFEGEECYTEESFHEGVWERIERLYSKDKVEELQDRPFTEAVELLYNNLYSVEGASIVK